MFFAQSFVRPCSLFLHVPDRVPRVHQPSRTCQGWPHLGLPDVWDFDFVQMTPKEDRGWSPNEPVEVGGRESLEATESVNTPG